MTPELCQDSTSMAFLAFLSDAIHIILIQRAASIRLSFEVHVPRPKDLDPTIRVKADEGGTIR